ncbi:hypothetical protein [Hymenobacter guriensis]|uniref:XRE family transcriptional regulator n=1 Tax=Hymenobacter guriensis TaxID=2793065 RepID=A0ABS0KYN6_9BACT|nr:hypothetical protein [Hymenobacter guriensis]MBG8552314.1 hypothetical protein [Hymenobacter guriensis]
MALLPDLLGFDSPAGMAKAAGIDPNTLRKAMQGPSKPSFDTLEAITSRWPKLSATWLLNGKGEPFLGKAEKPEPFLPGGTVNSMGATVMPAGGLEAVLGPNFGEDVDGVKQKPAVTDSKSFIAGLLSEIEGLKKDVKHLNTVVLEQRETIQYERDNNRFLRQQLAAVGKGEGSQQEAPVYYAVAEPQPPIGFGRVRSMWDYANMEASELEAA